MNNILFINPLKPGKLEAYKMFVAEITGPRKAEYSDLLKRYGLKNAKTHYQKFLNTEFVVVEQEIEDYAAERLPHFFTSTHPFDLWFIEQLQDCHDDEIAKAAGQPQVLLDFDAMDI
jgi:hypothetical protein